MCVLTTSTLDIEQSYRRNTEGTKNIENLNKGGSKDTGKSITRSVDIGLVTFTTQVCLAVH